MAGSREHGRYGHTSGLDIDRLTAELRRERPDPEPALREVGSETAPEPDRHLSKGGDPSLSKGHRRHIRRTEARRRARGDS